MGDIVGVLQVIDQDSFRRQLLQILSEVLSAAAPPLIVLEFPKKVRLMRRSV